MLTYACTSTSRSDTSRTVYAISLHPSKNVDIYVFKIVVAYPVRIETRHGLLKLQYEWSKRKVIYKVAFRPW